MKFKSNILLLLVLYASFGSVNAQAKKDSINKKRFNTLIIGTSVAYTASLVALNDLWYSNSPQAPFHFFNDNKEWLQVDKVGHMYSTYQISNVGQRLLLWSGVNKKKAAIWSSIAGFGLMIPIEIFDGHSQKYGASAGDLVANFTGAALFLTQQLTWGEIKIHPKFSFQQSGLAHLRPDVLGENLMQQMIKDYNGQTYWLSFDLYKFGRKGNKFPKWLNVAAGYGANNMIYAHQEDNEAANLNPYRQFYLAIDFDLTHIKTKSKFLNSCLFFVNMIHLPAPALEYNTQDNFKFHFLQW